MSQKPTDLGELSPTLAQILSGLEKMGSMRSDPPQTLGTTNFFINVTIVTNPHMGNRDNNAITIGAGAQANVNLGDGNEVNATMSIGEAKPLDAELAKLTHLIEELAKNLPPEEAETVKADLATFKAEAAKAEPRKAWYELSGEGLVNAAKAVAEMAPSIGTSVQAVLKLLAGVT